MIRKSNIYSWLSMLAMLPMVLTACLEEDNYEQRPNQTDKIQLTISLPEQTRIATNTRAVSNRVDYSIVNNLNIVLASGNDITKIYYFDESGLTPNDDRVIMTRNSLPMRPEEGDNKRYITIRGEEGDFDQVTEIYAIANYNNSITVKTIDALKQLKQTAADGQPNRANDCMMFGSTKQLTNGTLSLKRTLAMFSVKIDGSGLKEGVRITPKRMSLHNVPKYCFIGNDNKINHSDEFVSSGQTIDLTNAEGWGALTNTTEFVGGHELEPGTIPMFMFENLQGTNENIAIGDQINKHPKEYTGSTPADLQSFLDGNNGNKYSYILVEAEYYYQDPQNSNKGVQGTIAYRFLLGNNAYNDFNIKRNNYYQVTLTLKGNGGANEDGKEDADGNLIVNKEDLSWRIDMNIKDWGFVKDDFDFDCHATHGYLEVVGDNNWKISAGPASGQSWVKFYSETEGRWVEPTEYGECGQNGRIEYYVQTWSLYATGFTGTEDISREITLTIKSKETGETQTVTMKQWTPIKITNKVWVERFEEEDNLTWGYMGDDMNGTVTQSNPYFNTTFNFGESTTQHGLYNTWFMYFKENETSPVQTYCYRKSGRDLPHGAPTSTSDDYCLPDAETMKTIMNFKYTGNNPFQPLRTDKDYWTGSVDSNSKQSTYYLDSATKTLKTTQDRNATKRARAIYVTPY